MKQCQVISSGGDNRSAFLEFLSAESRHSFALHGCKTFESSPVELTVIKVTLADGTIVFYLTCQCASGTSKDVNATGCGYGRYASEGPGLMMNVLVSQEFIVDYGYLLKSREPGQPRLDSGSPPAGWFPLLDAVWKLLGCHQSASLQSISDVHCAALGFRLTLKVDTTMCNCSV